MYLIDGDAVLNNIKYMCHACGKRDKDNGIMCRTCLLDDAISIIENSEAVAPEIVYCKDCARCNQQINAWSGLKIPNKYECALLSVTDAPFTSNLEVNPELDYCSHGVRRMK